MVTRMILSSVLTIMTSVLNAGIRFIYLSTQLKKIFPFFHIRSEKIYFFIYFVINNKLCMYLIMAIIVHICSQDIYVKEMYVCFYSKNKKFTFKQHLPIFIKL